MRGWFFFSFPPPFCLCSVEEVCAVVGAGVVRPLLANG